MRSLRSILASVHGLRHWSRWLAKADLLRELPPPVGPTRSKLGFIENGELVDVRSLLRHLDGVYMSTGWRLMWWRGISPGLGVSGNPGADGGVGPAILCILRRDSEIKVQE